MQTRTRERACSQLPLRSHHCTLRWPEDSLLYSRSIWLHLPESLPLRRCDSSLIFSRAVFNALNGVTLIRGKVCMGWAACALGGCLCQLKRTSWRVASLLTEHAL